MNNEKCIIRYCPKCGKQLTQTHIRVEDTYVVRTRKCLSCKEHSIYTVEITLEKYNSSIKKLNAILDIVKS